jgi:hypothetical protein
MKKDKTEILFNQIEGKPDVNAEALELKSEDLHVEKKYYFNIDDEKVSIFKASEEPYIKIFLKAMGYYLCKPVYNSLQIDPPLYRKYRPSMLALDFSDEILCWIDVLERDYEKIEYISKHFHAKKLILIEMSDDIKKYIAEVKKKVHYKYHENIRIINLVPELIHYVDPAEVVIIQDWFETFTLDD